MKKRDFLILSIILLSFIIFTAYTKNFVFSVTKDQLKVRETINKIENNIILKNEISQKIDNNIIKNNVFVNEDNHKNIMLPKLRKEINKIPILMYHHLSNDSKKWNENTISPKKFREDMLYLKVLGYSPIHFKDYLEYKEGNKKLPDNPIFITFDDGYLSNYKYAYPVLKELNMKATISMIGWSVGRKFHKDGVTPIKEHFTWQQAKEMYDSGLIDIQHHTYDLHNPGDNVNYGLGVSKMPNETEEEYIRRFTKDTLKMKELIEQNVGNKVIVFVYPYGIYNETTEKIIKKLGFKVSLTIQEGVSDASKNLYLLKRINVGSSLSSPELMKKILKLQGQNIKVPFEDIKNQDERIKKLEEILGL